MPKRVSVALLISCACLLLVAWRPLRAQEVGSSEIDVSEVVPPDCQTCSENGYIRCGNCRGSGIVLDAKIDCRLCEGEGKRPCRRCNETGVTRCTACRKRTEDGETIRVISNPEYEEWEKAYGKLVKYGKQVTPEGEPVPAAPAEYIPCPYCNGTRERPCPDCEGTGKEPCMRCEGKGHVRGRGPCPICEGTAKVACPDCNSLEGLESVAHLKTLDQLLKEKLITREEYFKRRRSLIAKAKYIQKVIAERERQAALAAEQAKAEAEAEAQRQAQAAAEKSEDKPTPYDFSRHREKLTVLHEALAGGLLEPKAYEEKLREIGLPLKEVAEAEGNLAREHPSLQAYLRLRRAFREGKLDLEEYRKRLDEL